MGWPVDTAGRYASVSGTFTQLVEGATDWGGPAPVEGWTAGDVVWHLVDWIPAVLSEGIGLELPRRDPEQPDPVADWARFDSAMRAFLDEPGALVREFSHPMAGAMSAGAALDMLVTPDVFMHSWDLARATGQQVTLDADYCATLLAGMEPVEGMLRASGHYGARVDVPADADVQTRLVAFIGRDPHWVA
ncbi:MAG: TIGR03086 family metal-binding protein [Actinomycetota bacterium]|nr:TIGR03086 family metal-binding protein [Actinomycetota bacterium]